MSIERDGKVIIPHGDTIFRSGDHIVAYTRKQDAETLLRLQEFGGSGGFSRNAGYHRIFAEHRFFLHNWQGNELDLKIPPLDAGEYIAETAVFTYPYHHQPATFSTHIEHPRGLLTIYSRKLMIQYQFRSSTSSEFRSSTSSEKLNF